MSTNYLSILKLDTDFNFDYTINFNNVRFIIKNKFVYEGKNYWYNILSINHSDYNVTTCEQLGKIKNDGILFYFETSFIVNDYLNYLKRFNIELYCGNYDKPIDKIENNSFNYTKDLLFVRCKEKYNINIFIDDNLLYSEYVYKLINCRKLNLNLTGIRFRHGDFIMFLEDIDFIKSKYENEIKGLKDEIKRLKDENEKLEHEYL